MTTLDIKKLTTNTQQLTRLIVLVAVLLVVAVLSFGGYYYYDRYYSAKPKTMEQTVKHAEQALGQDPANLEKRMNLAEVYLFNGRYADAINNASQVMLQDPDNQKAWLVLGLSYAIQGESSEAILPLQKYVEANKDQDMPGLDKSLQAAAYYLGDCYLKLEQPEKAVDPLEKAVSWSKTDADAMYKLGLAYTATEKYEDALAMFHYATAFVPDFREAYEGMANVYLLTQQPDYANYALGMVSYSKKEYKAAIELLLKSAKATTDFAPTFSGLGLAYEADGDLKNAKNSYKTALQLEQNNLTALHGLQRIEILEKK